MARLRAPSPVHPSTGPDDAAPSVEGEAGGSQAQRRPPRLPRKLKRFFWEYDFSELSWEEDRDLVIDGILTRGDWDSIQWLLKRLGRSELRRWIEACRGRSLDPRQLRFSEVILGIPHRKVSEWIAAGDPAWRGRLGR